MNTSCNYTITVRGIINQGRFNNKRGNNIFFLIAVPTLVVGSYQLFKHLTFSRLKIHSAYHAITQYGAKPIEEAKNFCRDLNPKLVEKLFNKMIADVGGDLPNYYIDYITPLETLVVGMVGYIGSTLMIGNLLHYVIYNIWCGLNKAFR